MRRLIEAVAKDHQHTWSDATQKQFVIDSNAILEALILQYGIDAAVSAIVEQGYSPGGNYRSAANHLFDKALERKAQRRTEAVS